MALGGGIPLLALIATAAGAPAAGGRAPMMRVDFDAPAGCSSAEAFRRGVAARLERATTTTEGVPPARIQVRLTRHGVRVVGELRLSHEAAGPDTRTVEGATCDEVVDVLALTAALALQPDAHGAARSGGAAAATPPRSPTTGREAGTAPRATASRTAGAGPPATSRSGTASPAPRSGREAPAVASTSTVPTRPAPAPAVVVTPPPPLAPPSPPASALAPPVVVEGRAPLASRPVGTHLEVGTSAALARVLSAGPPNLGGGLMLGLSQLREDRIPRSLRVGWLYLPNDFLVHASAVVDQWYAFTLTACPGWGLRPGPVDVQVCARGIGGWITARDAVVTNPISASRAWVSAGALLRGGAALGAGFALELEAGVDAPLFHRQFITTPPRKAVGETPPVSLLVGIGLSRRL